jgi:hypothetical protein
MAITETFGKKMIKQTNKSPNQAPNGNDPNSITFDEFVKYLTGYSFYEQLEDEMDKEYDYSKGKEKP